MPADTILVRLKAVGAKKFSEDMDGAGRSTEQLRDEFGRFLPTGKKANHEFLGMSINSREASKGVKALGVVLATVAGAKVLGAAVAGTEALGVALLGLVAATGGAALVLGGFAVGAVAAFKSMSKQGGSAANELSKRFGAFKDLVGKELGPAFIPVFQAMTRALGPLGNLVRAIAPAFAVLGRAVARGVDQFDAALPMLGPRISELLRGVAKLVPTLVTLVIRLTRIFLDLANAALPYLNKGLEWLNGQLGKLSKDDIAKGVSGSFQTLGKVMTAIGNIVRVVGPVLMSIIKRAGELGDQLITALKPALPFWQNVLWPMIKGIGQGIGDTLAGVIKVIGAVAPVLGKVGTAMRPFRNVFQSIGRVIGWFITGPVFNLLGKIPKVGIVFRAIATVVRITGSAVGRFGRIIGTVIGKAVAVFLRAAGTIARLGGRIGSSLVRPFLSLGSKLLGPLRSGFGAVWKFLTSVGGRALAAGQGIVRKVVDGLKGMGRAVAGALRTGLGVIGDIGKGLANGVITLLNNAIPNKIPIPGAPDIPLPDNPIPKLARGGTAMKGGMAWVGERGPELVNLPSGSTVIPNGPSRRIASTRSLRAGDMPSRRRNGGTGAGGVPDEFVATVPVHVHVDGRQVSTTVARALLRRSSGQPA